MNIMLNASGTIKATLEIFWKGMLGIFIVMGIIYLSVVVLNKVTAPKKPKEKDNKENDSV